MLMQRKKKPGCTIRCKITILLLLTVLVVSGFHSAISIWCLQSVRTESLENSLLLGQTAAQDAEAALEAMAGEQLLSSALEKAAYIEEKFNAVISSVNGIAQVAEDIYENPQNYPDRYVSLPVRGSEELAAQLLWSERLTFADNMQFAGLQPTKEQAEEILKLGNLQDMLVQYNLNNDMISSAYLATASGWLIQADYIAYSKYSGDSDLPDCYEADTREWYQRALLTEMGETVYSDVMEDIHEGKKCIVCAKPVYLNGEIVAVAGIGSYLDIVSEVVLSTDVGDSGYAFLVNQQGDILLSGAEKGETAVTNEIHTNLLNSSNELLAEAAEDMVCGGSEFTKLTMDGREVYLAYAPLEGLGWSFGIVRNVEEVVAPALQSQQEILYLTDIMSKEIQKFGRRTVIIFLTAAVLETVVISIISICFTEKLTKPLHQLTKEIEKIGCGDLDRQIHITSGDEVEDLGNAFNKMTTQLKKYIVSLAAVTVDRERISTELAVATDIQADMLPDSHTVLTDRPEFLLHAGTFPAKEVGGDFYDFFLTDEDHLAFLVADVSGKGVPAALFMVVAKTLIGTHIMQGKTPAQAFTAVNAELCRNNRNGMFLTAWLGILELSTGKVVYANAGHNSPLVLQKAIKDEFVYLKERTGIILAVQESTQYCQKELQLMPGDKLFLYSDGITEANDERGRFFGEEPLKIILNYHKEESPEVLCESVKNVLKDFQGRAEQFDDITMLALCYQGSGIKYRNAGLANITRQAEVLRFLETVLVDSQVLQKNIRQILTVADEIFSNICYYSGALEVVCTCQLKGEQIQICFEDDGIAFNPLKQEEPDITKPLNERTEGGLGIYLVRKLMDEVIYCRDSGKNSLTLIKKTTYKDKL